MSSDSRLKLIKAILYTSDGITTDEKLNAVRYLIYGWDKETKVGVEAYRPWLDDLSVETRDIVKALSD